MKRNLLYSAVALLLSMFFGVQGTAQTVLSFTGDFQTYTVPAGITSIGIEALGAQGASSDIDWEGGQGAKMYGEFSVTPGDNLIILVGGMGGGEDAGSNGGGGGGTWVVLENTSGTYTFTGGTYSGTSFDLMVVAGGGGGTRDLVDQNGNPGVITEEGTTGSGSATTGGGATSSTPVGDGGPAAPSSWGSGGGGLLTNGGNDGSYGFGGNSFLSGGAIATGGTAGGDDGTGGFGGGGQGRGYYGGGGGGGYTGGDGGRVGGGGGSYNSGANQDNASGFNSGDGMVTITELCTGLTYTVSDDSVCDGEEVTLDATSTLGGTITWDGGVTNGTPFTPPVGTTIYTATSSDPGDCPQTVTIFVGELPTVDAGTDQTVCDGDSTMVTASGTATDWSWDGGISDGVNFLPSPGTTTYTVTGTIDSTGCQATDEVDITVVVPDVGVTLIGTSYESNQLGADSYQWIDCHDMSPIAGETNQVFTPTVDGDYAVIVTLSGCTDTSECVASYAGVTDLQQGNKPHVYPNPTEGMVTIFAKGTFTYQLMSPKGDILLQGEGEGTEELDLEDLPAGAYMINVITEFGVQPMKVMKR